MPEIRTIDDLTGEPHAVVFPDAPKTVRLALDAGDRMPEHDHPGDDVLLVLLDGRLDLHLDGEPHELHGGDVVRFDGDQPIEPHAVEDSTALLVFSPQT